MRLFDTVFVVVVTLMMSMQGAVMGFKEMKVGGNVQKWDAPPVNDTNFYEHWNLPWDFSFGVLK